MNNKFWQKYVKPLQLAAVSGFFELPTGPLQGTTNELPQNIANRLLEYLTLLAYPIAFVGIIYSAYVLLTSFGNPESYTRAKKNVLYMLTGIGLILFATVMFIIVRSFFTSLNK